MFHASYLLDPLYPDYLFFANICFDIFEFERPPRAAAVRAIGSPSPNFYFAARPRRGIARVHAAVRRTTRCGSLIIFTFALAYFGFVDLPISARFRYFKIYASFYYYKILKNREIPGTGSGK